MKESNSERIRLVREMLAGGSNVEFANAVGISPQFASSLCRDYNAGASVIKKIVDAYPQVSESWLKSGVGEMMTTQTTINNIVPMSMSERIVRDSAMSPNIMAGDVLRISCFDGTHVVMGGHTYYVVTKYNGEFVRIAYDDGDKIRFHAINGQYSDFSIPKDDVVSLSAIDSLERKLL